MQPRFAINGRFLTQPMAGVQRWAIQATKAIDALIDSGEYAALQGQIEILAPASARDFPLRHIPLRRCGFGGGYFWEQMELPLRCSNAIKSSSSMTRPRARVRRISRRVFAWSTIF
jgi:hypothetical protein